MRVLFLVRELATGTQTYTENVARELIESGVEVEIAYTGTKPQGLPKEPVRLDRAIPRQIDSLVTTQVFRFLFALQAMKSLIAEFKPHVILSQGLDENGFTSAIASILFRRPAFSFVHDLTLNELLLKEPKYSSLLYAISLFRQRITVKRLSGVLVGSSFMRQSIARMFGVSATVTRLGVRKELLGPKAVPADFPFQMIFIGNLSRKKRPEIPVEVLAALKNLNLRLVIIGDGPEGDSVSRLCESLNVVDRVDLKGRLSAEDLASELRGSHVCLVPSIWEGFGLAALEAMSCGVPLIASASGGLSELVENGKNGFLVPANSDSMWTEYVRQLYHDRALLRKLSERSYQGAKSYDWKSTAIETLEAMRPRHGPSV
jgi:glycosyltransferase involved in cell wall biosynthesis